MTLHERIATALGWSLQDAHSFSLQALREMLPIDSKLRREVTRAIETGSYISRA